MATALDLERKAKEAFVDDEFDLAVELYSQAIALGPPASLAADLYADRAQAHIKLGNLTEAVADANKAIELDPSLSKAYLRKGAACIQLEEYQTAKAALELGSKLVPSDGRFTRLLNECDKHITEEESHWPAKSVNAPTDASASAVTASRDDAVEPDDDMDDEEPVMEIPKPKYRHDHYNTPKEVVVTIFAKGVPTEHVIVDFGEQTLSVSIEIPGEEPYHFQPRLFGKIVPEKCKYSILSTKIEIRLAKAEECTWSALEYSKEKSLPQKISSSKVLREQKPSYPSSKTKTDWDKIVYEVKKEEKDEKLDGDAALNKFFRDIYGDADEDMRRAMMKSFVESNGTVLSTNWKDIGARTVESTPPDGMELKKWEI